MRLSSLGVVPLLLVLAAGSSSANGQATGCDVPIRWHIDELDERFALDVEEAARAVRQAGLLWQEAVGHRLLFQESETGMGVRFIYDERQEATQERLRLEMEAQELAARVEEARGELDEAREGLEARRGAYEAQSASFRSRLTSHNREVDDWSQQGGAPEAELGRLRNQEENLERERAQLNREVNELNTLIARVNERAAQANTLVNEHNRVTSLIEDRFPEEDEDNQVVSGRYRESQRSIGGWVISTFRQVDIYQFDSFDHLVIVLAHELGHALGLEHSEVPGSIMAPGQVTLPPAGGVRLHRSDVLAVRDLCYPALSGLPRGSPSARSWLPRSLRLLPEDRSRAAYHSEPARSPSPRFAAAS